MNKREELQEKYAEIAYKAKVGILLLSIRFGKCSVGIRLFKKFPPDIRILIIYPDLKIKKSWEDEFERVGYINENIIFSTNMSMNKHEGEKYDVVIVDECHLLSKRNIASLWQIMKNNEYVIGLTGTLSDETYYNIRDEIGLKIIGEYSREQAIEDGIVADYRINIIKVPLDNKTLINYKGKKKTEKQKFDAYSYVIAKKKENGENFMFLALGRMRIIQNSLSKIKATKELLNKWKEERVLVFCGLINVAEQLGIPVQHSKSEEGVLEEFAQGAGNHLAVIKMGNTGVTFKPLNKVLINYFSSSGEDLEQRIARAMNLEFSGQCADIWIVSSTEETEAKWLKKALSSFDINKIKYI